MRKNTRQFAHAAMIAALYIVLTHLQNALWPSGTTMAIQFRASEALCVLAFFTPAAIPGLSIGCMLFNITSGAALPWDFLIGSLATALATSSMYLTRTITIKKLPVLGLIMPALFNGLLVGWELAAVIGGGFWFNAICVAVGELAVLATLGSAVYITIRCRKLDTKLFS